jgi:acetyltransferase-like isoleucine patch superfamily enzyme
MALTPLRKVTIPDAVQSVSEQWLGEIDEKLQDPDCDRYELCRDTLLSIYYPGIEDFEEFVADDSVPFGTRAAVLAMDPGNITLEPEFYGDVDPERFARNKPLLWLWQSFDRSPMGGGNVDLGVQFRRILAPRIFKTCGKNFKCFQNVEFSFGYNMEVGDGVVVHRHVLLDDRGGLELHDGVSIADYANIYSHTHSILDQADVTNAKTILGKGVRITYHATVLAGVHAGEESMVGAGAVATRDIRPYHVNLGIPAKSVRVKPNAPEGNDTLDTARMRSNAD